MTLLHKFRMENDNIFPNQYKNNTADTIKIQICIFACAPFINKNKLIGLYPGKPTAVGREIKNWILFSAVEAGCFNKSYFFFRYNTFKIWNQHFYPQCGANFIALFFSATVVNTRLLYKFTFSLLLKSSPLNFWHFINLKISPLI